MMNEKSKSEYNVPNLERALVILDYVVGVSPKGISIADVVKELGFPNSSVFRIMNTLTKHKYLIKDEQTKRFTLGHKFFSMAHDSADKKLLIECAIPVMKKLRDLLKETVVITVMSDEEGMVIDQVPGLYPFRFVCDPGTRQPLHASASVKAILANLAEEEKKKIFTQINFSKLTENTILTLEEYKKELTEAKAQGYAFDREEGLIGVVCVAAPIFNKKGYPIASVTLTAPIGRLKVEELGAVGEIVRQYCDLITDQIKF